MKTILYVVPKSVVPKVPGKFLMKLALLGSILLGCAFGFLQLAKFLIYSF